MPGEGRSAPAPRQGIFGPLLDLLSGILMRRPGPLFEVVFALVAVVASTVLRAMLDDSLPPGFPFLTFFPAVMLTLVFASIRAGVVVAVVCGLISWFWFIPPEASFRLSSGTVLAIGFYMLIVSTEILFVAAASRALHALQLAREHAADLARARELMFSELQHRVSNNLATVAALLRMQANRAPDAQTKQALVQAQLRIGSISRLQRRLHAPDHQSIELGGFLRALATDTIAAAGDGRAIGFSLQADRLQATNDQAVPLGLIASELMMNAIEHGGTETQPGRIDMRLAVDADAGQARLEVRDNGPGLPADFDLTKTTSLGLTIARQFATQLGGVLTMQNDPAGGMVARLTFAA